MRIDMRNPEDRDLGHWAEVVEKSTGLKLTNIVAVDDSFGQVVSLNPNDGSVHSVLLDVEVYIYDKEALETLL